MKERFLLRDGTGLILYGKEVQLKFSHGSSILFLHNSNWKLRTVHHLFFILLWLHKNH